MYFWSLAIPVSAASKITGVSRFKVVQWFQYFHDICSWSLLRSPLSLGGIGKKVQIDESVISKRKYHKGRKIKEKWVFGLYNVERKVGVLEFVKNRKKETLLPIIKKYVKPGTEIHSDQWKAYKKIPEIDVFPP